SQVRGLSTFDLRLSTFDLVRERHAEGEAAVDVRRRGDLTAAAVHALVADEGVDADLVREGVRDAGLDGEAAGARDLLVGEGEPAERGLEVAEEEAGREVLPVGPRHREREAERVVERAPAHEREAEAVGRE